MFLVRIVTVMEVKDPMGEFVHSLSTIANTYEKDLS